MDRRSALPALLATTFGQFSLIVEVVLLDPGMAKLPVQEPALLLTTGWHSGWPPMPSVPIAVPGSARHKEQDDAHNHHDDPDQWTDEKPDQDSTDDEYEAHC